MCGDEKWGGDERVDTTQNTKRAVDSTRNAWSYLKLATSHKQRAVGLLLTDVTTDELMLIPCNDIHTVGMHHALDVAFLSSAGEVLEVHYALDPCKRVHNKQAAAVVERFASNSPWFQVGDRLMLKGANHEDLSCL